MWVYFNFGYDIESVEQMYDVMMLFGGILLLSVMFCDCGIVVQGGFYKIDGVSFFLNIVYIIEGICVWRVYNIGFGKLIFGVEVDIVKFLVLEVNKSYLSMFIVVIQCYIFILIEGFQDNVINEVGVEFIISLFVCLEEGCVKIFFWYFLLFWYFDCGKY